MKKISKDEWMAEGTRLFGPDFMDWKFECPSCGHIQTVKDFQQYKDKGATPDTARLNCIGRYDGEHGSSPIGSKPGPCNYTSGGLFNLNPIVIVDGEKEYTSFGFAVDCINRYNFDRYKNNEKMAMGIAVHAKSLSEATRKALLLNNDSTEKLIFTDNTPCITQCKMCDV